MADIKEAVDATEDFNDTAAKFSFDPGTAIFNIENGETYVDKKCEKHAIEHLKIPPFIFRGQISGTFMKVKQIQQEARHLENFLLILEKVTHV